MELEFQVRPKFSQFALARSVVLIKPCGAGASRSFATVRPPNAAVVMGLSRVIPCLPG